MSREEEHMDAKNIMDEIARRAFGKTADELTCEELDDILDALRQAEKLRELRESGGSVSCLRSGRVA